MPNAAEMIRACGLPRHEAERLLVVASRRSKVELLGTGTIDIEVADRFQELVALRGAGTPLQHLEGTVQFGPLELKTDSRALVPRPETEELWEKVVARIGDGDPKVVVDLCTGSGNLALALKHRYPNAAVHGTDVSGDALDLARENAATTGLDVTWGHGDLFHALPRLLHGTIDVIVSNPPYVAVAEFDALPADVRDHEPYGALIAGHAGDEVLARIAGAAGEWLRPGGLIACEIGAAQGASALSLFADLGGVVEHDLAGRQRHVFGRRPVR